MQERRVGRSGLRVSRLALGTMTFGEQVDEIEAEEQVTTFLDAGGTMVDTAPIYGSGACEPVLGRILGRLGVRDRIVLTGKAGLGHRDGEVVRDASRKTLLDQLDTSLRDLGTDHLDVWQIHRWDEKAPLDEALGALEHAVRTGRTRYVGISNFYGWQTGLAHAGLAAQDVPLISNQVEYSLLRRDVEREVVPVAEYVGMGLFAWSPLGRGVLTGKYRGGIPSDSRAADAGGWEGFVAPYLTAERTGVVEALAKASDGLDVTMAHAALAWLLTRPQVACAIIGARTTEQLKENLAADEVELPPEIVEALDDVSNPEGWDA
ncbi:aldo/keto reductase [Aeromicrobium terrae]|uniref:Aldo/keto reductase n=1 Tax=Aeromicrobium terrae TaxID=2498846 RepID=A0A5C8NRN6_9ACTN|nr:aldo/keto reductase [Aeromicrobium terrae]TXL63113.1 aldo/keto reductase [Aeromicrobium terrae]